MIYIIDGMLYVRRELEKDLTGRAPRKIINAMLSMQPGDIALWCWDAPGSRQRRQELYPAYKGKRSPSSRTSSALTNTRSRVHDQDRRAL